MDFKPAENCFSCRSSRSSARGAVFASLRDRFAAASLALLVGVLALDPRTATGADAAAPPRPASTADVQKLLKDLKIPPDDSTAVDLTQALQSAEPPAALSDDDKARWQTRRQDALGQLELATRLRTKALDLENDSNAAAKTLATLQHANTLPGDEVDDEADQRAGRSLVQLEQDLAQQQAELAELQDNFAEKEAELKRRPNRRVEIPKLVSAANERVEELDNLLEKLPTNDLAEELRAVERAALLAERLTRRFEIDGYQKELLNFDATAEVVLLQRDRAARDVSHKERSLKQLRDVVADKRKAEAEKSAREAQMALIAAAGAHPAVRALAAENANLAERRKKFEDKLQKKALEVELEQAHCAGLLKYFDEIQEKDKLSDVTNRGALLHKQGKMLPDDRQLRKDIKALATELAETQLVLFELTEQGSGLADPEREVEKIMSGIGGTNEVDRSHLEQALRQHLDIKRSNLNALAQAQSQYSQLLSSLHTQLETLADRTAKYRVYLAERVMWVPSTTSLSLAQCPAFQAAQKWLCNPRGWYDSAPALLDDAIRNPLLYVSVLIGGVASILLRGRLRVRIRELGGVAGRGHCDVYRPTAFALAYTAMVALIWPALMAFAGWRLTMSDAASQGYALGMGLSVTVAVLMPLVLLRHVCRPLGLAESHFDWPQHSITLLRKHLRRLLMVMFPLVLLTAMVQTHGNEEWSNSVGRAMFILTMVAIARFIQQVLRPTGGVLEQTLAKYRGQWLDRLRWIWFPTSVGAPLALAVLAALGFYYTATQLAWRLEATLGMLLGLVLIHSSLLRLLVIVRRRLAIEQARQRRAALCEHRDGTTATADATPEVERLDLAAVSLQTRKLLQSAIVCAAMLGMCAVWVDVLPALKRLNEMELWSTGAIAIASRTTAATDSAVSNTIDDQAAFSTITVGNLLAAMLVGAMTLLAARNIPGLLEITVLQKLPLQAGSGYAITTICRYLIVLIGLTWTSSQIGLKWDHVQWLVAAVSVGLGFGLQEIFGNFISGLIILFERPIRVGDTITVGDVSGTVSRIRIRATTIIDGDRKESIVPNKVFITGQVVNWTLTDEIGRIVIPVRIAVDADATLAQRLMLKAAQEHPNAMADPAPSAWLESFGENSLELQLNVYLPSPAFGSRTRHELINAINQSFIKAGIAMAQPRRDVHLHPPEALALLVDRRKSA